MKISHTSYSILGSPEMGQKKGRGNACCLAPRSDASYITLDYHALLAVAWWNEETRIRITTACIGKGSGDLELTLGVLSWSGNCLAIKAPNRTNGTV